MPREKILIVEDESVIALNIKRVLESWGYEVTGIAVSGTDALSSISQSPPNMILMDIILTDEMDGITAAQEIKKSHDIPVIYLTAHADQKTLERAKATVPYGYIMKPVNQSELRSALEISLYRHGLEKRVRKSEEKYRGLIESINDIVFSTDEIGVIVFIGPQIRDLTGYDPSEIIGRSLMDFIFQDDRKIIERRIDELKKGIIKSTEYRIISRSGEPVWIRSSTKPVYINGVFYGLRGVITDISGRRRAEESLRESEERFKEIFNNAMDGLFIVDVATKRHYSANDMFCRMLGYSQDEIKEISVNDIHPEEDIPWIAEIFERQVRKEIQIAEDVPVKRKDGSVFYADIASFPLIIGGDAYLMGFFRDISERKEAQRALRESEQVFSTFFEHAPVGIVNVGIGTSKFTQINQRFCDIMGYTREELMSMDFSDITHPDDLDISAAAQKELMTGCRETVSIEKRYIRKDGSTVWARNTLFTLCDESGSPRFSMAIIEDITDRKLSEIELNRLATAVEQATEDITLTDIEGNIQYVNPAFERVTGYLRSEVIGQNPRLLKSGRHGDSFYREMWDTISSGNVWTGRIVNRKKDGSHIVQDASISPIRDAGGSIAGYVAVKRDVTDHIQIQSQLLQAQKMEAIGNLAGGLAHDFNNLLSGILGSVNLLEMILGKEKLRERDSVDRYLETIIESSDRASDMINQLLTLSRKQDLKPVPVNLNQSLKHVMKICQSSFPKSIEMKFEFSDLPVKILADPTQMEQVILNLCVNASHAMTIMRDDGDRQGGSLRVTVDRFRADNGFRQSHPDVPGNAELARISVVDNGVGMDEETRSRIFDPFFTMKDKNIGSGLGLAMVYNIVTQHKGIIDVSSEKGQGTAITVYLPLLEAEGDDFMEKNLERGIHKGTGSVLVIDDEELVRKVFKGILEECGYRVVTAKSGEEGISIYTSLNEKFDAVIIDMSMPSISGMEVFNRLREIDPGIKTMIASGFGMDERVEKMMEAGIRGFIHKPFTATQLSQKMKDLLGS